MAVGYKVRTYENGDLRWVEPSGAATATSAEIVTRAVREAFAAEPAPGLPPPQRFILDLSQVITVGGRTLEAILEGVPPGRDVGLIPPPQPGWFAGVGRRIDVSVTVYASERHALLALGLDSRGVPRDRPTEKRRYPRIETALRSRLWFQSPRGERFGKAIVGNLSKSGAYLKQLDVELGPEEFRYFASGAGPLMLVLPIGPVTPDQVGIAARGERRHIRTRVVRMETVRGVPHLGVHFEDIDPEVEDAISTYITRGRARN